MRNMRSSRSLRNIDNKNTDGEQERRDGVSEYCTVSLQDIDWKRMSCIFYTTPTSSSYLL